MRFALIGTPRSGNTLLRSVIAASLDLTECASHDPGTLLGHLPRGSITQVHAPYSTALHESLREREVVIVTPIRHPLDALLSMLHFAQFEPQVAQWLGGNHLRDVLGCDPTSRAFREFALGNGARALLQVSVDWAPHAALTVRFRDFCHDPEAIVTRPTIRARMDGGRFQPPRHHAQYAWLDGPPRLLARVHPQLTGPRDPRGAAPGLRDRRVHPRGSAVAVTRRHPAALGGSLQRYDPGAPHGRRTRLGVGTWVPGMKGPPAHPPEHAYPCCLPALGGFTW